MTAAANPKTLSLPASADLATLMHSAPVSLDFVLPGFIRGTVGGIISPGGLGKSYWGLSVALSLAAGPEGDISGLQPSAGRVLVLSGEDPEAVLAQRMQAMKTYIPDSAVLANVDFRTCLGMSIDLMDETWFIQVRDAAKGCRLVILDTLTRFHNLDENAAGDMKSLLGQLERLAHESDAAVLYVHHTSKAAVMGGQGTLQQAARGSSVLVDNARWVSYLTEMRESEAKGFGLPVADCVKYVRWNISKQNYAAARPDQWYMRGEGGVLVPVTLPPPKAVALVAVGAMRAPGKPEALLAKPEPARPTEPVAIPPVSPAAPAPTLVEW